MHANNKLWLKDLVEKYPKYFKKARVLELGSGDTSGELVIRSFFKRCEYVGVDRVGKEGGVKGVDIVVDAKSAKFKNAHFDTLVCFSMFEHDKDWKLSLSHNLAFLKQGSMIFISFGSEGNRRHDPEPWNPVGYKEFIRFCSSLPLKIEDAFFEEERFGYDCVGVFNIVATKINKKTSKMKKYNVSGIAQVPERPFFKRHISILLYFVNRSKRNLRQALGFRKKYFYSQ